MYIDEQCLADISRNYIQLLAEEVVVWRAGFHTRQLVSRVGTRLVFPDDRDTGVSYCRLLLGDTMLKDDSFRTGTSDSPIWCDCGIERETADHFLLRCSKYSEARSVMKNIPVSPLINAGGYKVRVPINAGSLINAGVLPSYGSTKTTNCYRM